MLNVSNLKVDIEGSRILNGISLSVAAGELVCLVGRNGAGKTTTFRTVMGYRRLLSGDITFDGADLAKLPTWQIAQSGGARTSSHGDRLCRGRRMALDRALCSEIIVTLGSVPLANYETPGTQELAEALAPLVAEHDAILMANHGVVTCGADLLNAYMNMETVEHFAKIALVTHMLGKQQTIKRPARGESCAKSG